MECNFDHFLLTRFNVRIPWLSRFQAESHYCNPEWLRRRIDLFDRYCYPSVVAQTSKRYRWLVFFDHESPDFLRAAIERWQAYQPFEACFTDGLTSAQCADFVRARITGSRSHLLTTRLDSDDMLSRDFIARIQNHAATLEAGFINPLHGYQLLGEQVYTVSQQSNAFISCLEPIDNFHTVLGFAHGEAATLGNVYDNTDGRDWMQIIHGGNVANRLEDGRQRFPLPLAARHVIPLRSIWRSLPLASKLRHLLFLGTWGLKKVFGRLLRSR